MTWSALPAVGAGGWHLVTRLGEAQILLPAMVLAAAWLWRQPGGAPLARTWLLGVAGAALVTTASKVAFLGYAIGWPALDFTGFSGHAMFAAAVLPPLLRLVAGPVTATGRRRVITAGYLLALAVALSRVQVGAHSVSEVVAGSLLGGAAAALALRAGPWPALRLRKWVPVALLGWGLLGIVAAPPSTTHGAVTRLALALSGRPQAYQRWEMHRDHQRRQSPPAVSMPGG